MRLIIDSHALVYDKELNVDAIYNWIMEGIHKPYVKLTTIKEVESFQQNDIGLLMLMKNKDESSLVNYQLISISHQDVPFAYVQDQSLLDEIMGSE